MDIRIAKHNEATALCDTAIIPFTEGIEISQDLLYLDSEVEAMISHMLREKVFTGKKDQIQSFRLAREENPRNIILVGLGDDKCVDQQIIRNAVSSAIREAKKLKSKVLEMHPVFNPCSVSIQDMVSLMAKYAVLSDYDFRDFKMADENAANILELNIIVEDDQDAALAKTAVDEGILEGESICIARNLVNKPSNLMTPSLLAEEAQIYGNQYGFDVDVLELGDIQALDMQSFMAVGQGSEEPIRLIVMKYHPNTESSEIYGLVGKGLTYDSGGYSIKPTDGMMTMKSDMAGAAAVIGAMTMIASNKLNVNITAVVAACENMISGRSYRPGDIIGSMAGKFIEINNTDAEGRLTLADAVTYAIREQKVTKIIDIATLTGAALTALGDQITACLSSDDQMYSHLERAAVSSGERIWRLPVVDEYRKFLKSDVADLKNSGGRLAGTITAGLFIKEFTEDLPWIHLDIAGTSWADKASCDCPMGGTGTGVSLLYHFFKNLPSIGMEVE